MYTKITKFKLYNDRPSDTSLTYIPVRFFAFSTALLWIFHVLKIFLFLLNELVLQYSKTIINTVSAYWLTDTLKQYVYNEMLKMRPNRTSFSVET